jgi:hypothetical protein
MKSPQRLFCLAVVLLLPSATLADSITLFPNRDTTIYQANANNSNGAGSSLFVGTNLDSTADRGLVRFDIAGKIPAGSTITGAQLFLLLDTQLPPSDFFPRQIDLRRLLADWGEGITGQGTVGAAGSQGFPTPADGTTATWSHRFFNTVPWANAGGDFAATASASATVGFLPQPYFWGPTPTMISDVQSWLDNPASNFGWLLLGDESHPGTVRRFFTREAQNPAGIPALTINFISGSSGGPPHNRVRITAPANATAGTPFDITVSVLDGSGNVDTGYTGTLTFSSTDPFPGVVPSDYTFSGFDQGTHTFPAGVVFYTAGPQTITAKDTMDHSISGSTTVTVGGLPAFALKVVAPQTAVAGKPFDVTVKAVDFFGNADANYRGTVTWVVSDFGVGVVIPAPYMFQASDNGVHTFSGGFTLVTPGDIFLFAFDFGNFFEGFTDVTVNAGP